jgi:hypothetical protein
MILLKPDQLAEFVAFIQERGERMVIVVTPERMRRIWTGSLSSRDGASFAAKANGRVWSVCLLRLG